MKLRFTFFIHRSVKKAVYVYYLRAMGAALLSSAVFFHVSSQAVSVGSNVWLAKWSNDNSTRVGKQEEYLTVYGVLGVASCLAFSAGWLSTLLGGLRASELLHSR